MIRPKYERVIHFRHVVVFGGQPKHRNSRNALLTQLCGQADRR